MKRRDLLNKLAEKVPVGSVDCYGSIKYGGEEYTAERSSVITP